MQKLFIAIILVAFMSACKNGSSKIGPNVKDIDGNVYPTIITSCGQVWTVKNLSVSSYCNGDSIPQVTDSSQWHLLRTGAWCWYKNDSMKYCKYGKLYNWYAVNDSRGLAPEGWHIPSDDEWTELIDCYGGPDNAGNSMYNNGFSLLLAGTRSESDAVNVSEYPKFENFYSIGVWWSSTLEDNIYPICFLKGKGGVFVKSSSCERSGHSVRLIKDNSQQ